jgi:hypothetical protein
MFVSFLFQLWLLQISRDGHAWRSWGSSRTEDIPRTNLLTNDNAAPLTQNIYFHKKQLTPQNLQADVIHKKFSENYQKCTSFFKADLSCNIKWNIKCIWEHFIWWNVIGCIAEERSVPNYLCENF